MSCRPVAFSHRTDSLLKLAEPPAASATAAAQQTSYMQPSVQPPTELVAATTAALAETRAGVRCVLSRQLVELQRRAADAAGLGGAGVQGHGGRTARVLDVIESEVELRHHLEAIMVRPFAALCITAEHGRQILGAGGIDGCTCQNVN